VVVTLASDVFRFRWDVPEAGYKWVRTQVYRNGGNQRPQGSGSELEVRLQWVLTDDLELGAPEGKKYDPLQNFPALFREFAQVPPRDRDAILAFANRYGNLGIIRPLHLTAPGEPNRLRGVWGETHQDWARQVDGMTRAVRIWDMVEARDSAGLSRHIRWKQTGVGYCWCYDSHPDLPKDQIPPSPGRHFQLIEPVLDLLKQDNIFVPAKFLVQRWVNEHLRDRASPLLQYDLDLATQILRIVPDNLLGAMWLQFAQTIGGNKKHRPCKECGKWFEISVEDDARTDRRLFCDDPCKFRDYRRRQKRARQLQAEGRSIKEIAAELNTDPKTLKRWLAERTR
jgi:hypothetical protein